MTDRQLFRTFRVAILLGVVCQCSNPFQNSQNAPPEIHEILVSPLPARVGVWEELTAVATDKDGDALTYYWGCSSGEFFPGETTENPTSWRASRPGTYVITCTVSDGKDRSSKSISVEVI